jgi:hypothetical protein
MVKILLTIILSIFLNAKVTVDAPKTFFGGDAVNFSISVSGNDVDFPDIKEIDGYLVQKTGTSSSTTIINGVRSQNLSYKYTFYPMKDVVIPSFDINVNGKIEKTKSVKITLQQVKKTKSNDFDLTISVDKDSVYVGEELLLTMTFKYKKDIQLYDLQFIQPNFDNFWSKQVDTNTKKDDDLYVVQELNYLLFPQKSGTLDIKAFHIDAVLPDFTRRNSFFSTPTKTKRIYSNKLQIQAKKLPDDIYLVGNFRIKSTVDKTDIKQGEAVSYKLHIEGRGNIDDLEEFSLDIPNVTIYDNPSNKDFNIKDGKYGGIYKKSYSIVSQNDFKIPPITLKYFDKENNETKTIQTKQYDIKVQGLPKVKKQLEVKKELLQPIETKVVSRVVETSDNDKILFFILGMLSTLAIFGIYILFSNRKKESEELPLEIAIKKCATKTELLKIIVPFVNIDEKLDKMIYKVEKEDFIDLKSIKKELRSIVKGLKL